MATKLSAATNIDSIQLQEQASAPATPGTGYMQLYADNAGNAHIVNDGGINKVLSGLNTDATDVSTPPTDAELDAIFTSPAAVGNGFACLLDDAGGDANVYLVTSNGTSWWYVALTKAI